MSGAKGLTEDGRVVCAVLGDEAREVGWSETGRRTHIDRTALYRVFKSLGDGPQVPNFVTVCHVAEQLGFRLRIERIERPAA